MGTLSLCNGYRTEWAATSLASLPRIAWREARPPAGSAGALTRALRSPVLFALAWGRAPVYDRHLLRQMSVRSQQRSKYKVHESFDAQTVTWNAGSQFRERFCEVGRFLDLPG